ncbi:UNVERIFIED_CONTAM: hypothetical protein NCL1_34656 [Trichonephila clavipes]
MVLLMKVLANSVFGLNVSLQAPFVSTVLMMIACAGALMLFNPCSLLGMHLFGGRFCRRGDGRGMCTCEELQKPDPHCLCDRMNFDNFLWATVTVFQFSIAERSQCRDTLLFSDVKIASSFIQYFFEKESTFLTELSQTNYEQSSSIYRVHTESRYLILVRRHIGEYQSPQSIHAESDTQRNIPTKKRDMKKTLLIYSFAI